MIKKSYVYLSIALGVLTFASCNKSAGKGGSSAITGKVHVKEYNGLGTLVGESDVADQDVYIVYGIEDSIFDDKAATGFDGQYQFQYLAKGKYTLYTYSDCWTCESGDSAVFVDVEISENRTEFDAPQLNILKL